MGVDRYLSMDADTIRALQAENQRLGDYIERLLAVGNRMADALRRPGLGLEHPFVVDWDKLCQTK